MKLLVSACLLGANCKYSGDHNYCPAVARLSERHTLIPVCPEQLGGLPTPRTPAERVGERVMTENGRDVTEQYRRGAEEAVKLAKLLGAEGAVLKFRSPSCGCGTIYDGTFSHTRIPGNGVAAQALLDLGLPVWTEENIDDL